METTEKMCAECPFRDTSAKGWLGPYDGPEQFIHGTLGEAEGMACHMTLNGREADIKRCSGGLQCANKSFKLYRNPELRAAAEAVTMEEDSMRAHQFIEYHTI